MKVDKLGVMNHPQKAQLSPMQETENLKIYRLGVFLPVYLF